MHSRAPLLVALAALACTPGPRAPQATSWAPLSPSTVGGIMFTELDLPASGVPIGGHYRGATFNARQSTYFMSDGVRDRWMTAARVRGEALMRGAGFRVRAIGPATSDASAIVGVQYGLQGKVTELEVRTVGALEPFQVQASVDVSWEVLDLGSGGVVFGRTVRGTARLGTGGVEDGVAHALDQALERLLADSLFLRALATPRASPIYGGVAVFTAVPPGSEPILIDTAALAPSADSGAVERVSAGLATLLGNRGSYLGTATIITHDGLALASVVGARGVRNNTRPRARLPNGVERPVRMIRMSGRLGVGLVQIACPGECVTVDWYVPISSTVEQRVLLVGAPPPDEGAAISVGRLGGRWGLAHGVTLQLPGSADVLPGDPIADLASGRVFGMAGPLTGRPSALLLDEVFRALNIRVTGGLRR